MSIQLYSSPMKYKDPNTGNYTNIIGISGNPGRGIASVELNNDYTLTITFTDNTSITTTSIRGNGIDTIEKTSTSGLIDTYTITDSDGDTYTFTVSNGMVPNLTIGTVAEGPVAAATITGTNENPVLNLVLPNANVPTRVSELENDAGYLTEHQDLSDYVQKTDYATPNNAGIVKVNPNFGITASGSTIIINPATTSDIQNGISGFKPITTLYQHNSTFYGLAKAAGDSTQSQSANAVGTYTNEAKSAIQTMLDVPSNAAMQQAISNINTMKIHICTSEEYDAQTGVPTVQNPDTQTFYLVPGGESSNLFIEWVYVNSAWERFGSADIDLSGYATKADTVLETTLSRGRKAGSTVGTSSFAFGNNVEASALYTTAFGTNTTASGNNSFAEGAQTIASGTNSHAEGNTTTASGAYSHAEGRQTTASAANSHAEGRETVASGSSSHAEGYSTNALASGKFSHVEGQATISAGQSSHVGGEYNSEDSYADWPLWRGNTEYAVGDKVKILQSTSSRDYSVGYICKEANNDSNWDATKWINHGEKMNYAHIVGNGTADNARSNAYALDWDGNGHYMGDVYVGANADSSGGTKVATVDDIAAIEVPVNDVQVNSVSVVDGNGVANIPVASKITLGTIKAQNADATEAMASGSSGGSVIINGVLYTTGTNSDVAIRMGVDNAGLISTVNQHKSVFYGLAKVAGADMRNSLNTIGTYTEEAKTAIKSMLGVQDGLKVVRLI